MSVIKVGALQDLSNNTEFDLTNNIVYTSTIKNSSSATNNLVLNSDGTVTSGNLTVTNVNGAPANRLVQGAAQASTSGTFIDFTGIPSWVKRITVMFNGVSTNGSSNTLLRIGTSSGIETTGYDSGIVEIGATGTPTTTSTAGFLLSYDKGSNDLSRGVVNIINMTGNTWIVSGNGQDTATTWFTTYTGIKTLSGTLDRVRITTVNGTDTFDAGSINIMYEG